jgi:hypothetical protein
MRPHCTWAFVWLFGLAGAILQAAAPNVPPLPPLTPAPMEFFRNLLATNAAGRSAFLAERPPEQRKLLESKLTEYQALPAEERELRLALTDLRHYLLIFLRWPADLRAQSLVQVPEKYRPLIVERLKIWDALAPEERAALLTNETAMSFMVRLGKASQATLADLPPQRRAEMEAALQSWQATPPSQRQALAARFNQFFDLTELEKRQTLAVLPMEQRLKQQRMLAVFERLPKQDRERCALAFDQFLALPPAEREQFLRNAARWQAMSAEERQALRKLVIKFPPLPPGFLDGAAAKITAMPTNRPRVN